MSDEHRPDEQTPDEQVTDQSLPRAQDEEPTQPLAGWRPTEPAPAPAVQPEGRVYGARDDADHEPPAGGCSRARRRTDAVRRAAGPVPAAAGRRPRTRGPDRAVPDPGSVPPAAGPAAGPALVRPGSPAAPDVRRPDDGLPQDPAVGLAGRRLPRPGRRHARRPRRRRDPGRARVPSGHQRQRDQRCADADRRPAGGRQRLGRRGGAGAPPQHRPDRGRAATDARAEPPAPASSSTARATS